MRLRTVCASISAVHEVHCKKKKKVLSFVTGKKEWVKKSEGNEIETQGKEVKSGLGFFHKCRS